MKGNVLYLIVAAVGAYLIFVKKIFKGAGSSQRVAPKAEANKVTGSVAFEKNTIQDAQLSDFLPPVDGGAFVKDTPLPNERQVSLDRPSSNPLPTEIVVEDAKPKGPSLFSEAIATVKSKGVEQVFFDSAKQPLMSAVAIVKDLRNDIKKELKKPSVEGIAKLAVTAPIKTVKSGLKQVVSLFKKKK